MAIGAVETLVKRKISQSSGPAFVLSGRALDVIAGEPVRMRIELEAGILPGSHEALEWLICLVDLVVSRWSEREALAVYGAMRDLTQEETAQLPAAISSHGSPPTQQAIAGALKRSAWKSHVRPVLDGFARIIGGEG